MLAYLLLTLLLLLDWVWYYDIAGFGGLLGVPTMPASGMLGAVLKE